MKNVFFLLLAVAMLGAGGCGSSETDRRDDRLLAEVYNKRLYLSELQGVLPEGLSGKDSDLIINAYAQRWVRDQLLMYEAERNIPKDLNIDQLVRDYRASLVRFNFEEQLIAEKLDSTVSEAETKEFYETNKDQFQLETTILKCLLLKLPQQAPQSEINKLWNSRKSSDRTALEAAARQHAVLTMLDEKKWYTLNEIAALLPKGTLTAENIGSRREGTLADGDFRYYYRVLEVAQGKTTAPYEYVREQASKVILHKRKQVLLDKWKEDLYQRELRRDNIKIAQ